MPIRIIRHRWMFPMQSCRVYDGDTLMELTVDLGFNATLTITGRLYGIDTPEVRGPERKQGLEARDWLRVQINKAEQVLIETRPPTEKAQGKFGRWLITIWADGVNLNDSMVEAQIAKRVTY